MELLSTFKVLLCGYLKNEMVIQKIGFINLQRILIILMLILN